MFKRISDNKIIEGIKNQDEKILEWLYDYYYPAVKKYIIRNKGCEDDVSDVFQDTIIILYNQITDSGLKLTSDLKGYFFGIARNNWNIQLRYRKKMMELTSDIEDDITGDESNHLLLERIVFRAFSKLKPDCQKVFKLYAEGYSYEDISIRLKLKNDIYARRKKYLCKESLMEIIKKDPEYQEYLCFHTR